MSAGANVKVKKDGGEIDAITGATISSRAVTQAIELAKEFYAANRDQIVEAIDQAPGDLQ
jgi:electron transport complex protein RnfG